MKIAIRRNAPTSRLKLRDERVVFRPDLERELRSVGYLPGFPPHLTRRNRAVDATSTRRMVCGACSTRGLGCKPFHKPGGGYRLLAVCSKCGAVEE